MISTKDLIYWYREFAHLLSGWTTEEQIQFHRYAIKSLTAHLIEKGGH